MIGLVVAFVIMLVALVAVSGVSIAWYCKQHCQNVRMQKKAQSRKNVVTCITILMNKQ